MHVVESRLFMSIRVSLLLTLCSFGALAETPKLVAAAHTQTLSAVQYDGSYVRIAYPMGDVAADRGVCTGAKLTGPESERYLAGDIVTWMLPGNLPHISIASDRKAPGTERPLIIHNIGAGPREEDMLRAYPVTGHYRYKVQ